MLHDLRSGITGRGFGVIVETANVVSINADRPGRPVPARSVTPNLISSWRALHGELTPAGLEELNQALGTKYTLNRLYEWERGDRTPNPSAMNYMLCEVLPGLLIEAGLSEGKAKAVVANVALPARDE